MSTTISSKKRKTPESAVETIKAEPAVETIKDRIVRTTVPADSEYLQQALDGKLPKLSTKARAIVTKVTEIITEMEILERACQRENIELQRLELLLQEKKLLKQGNDLDLSDLVPPEAAD